MIENLAPSRKRISAVLFIEFLRRRITNEWPSFFGTDDLAVAKPDWIVSRGPARWHRAGFSGLLAEEIAGPPGKGQKIDYIIKPMGRHRSAHEPLRRGGDAALDEQRSDLGSPASWSDRGR